jgi:hypothetical protein
MPTNATATVLQDYISNYTGNLDWNEQRPSEYAAIDLFKKQTNGPGSLLDANVKAQLEKSFNTTVKIPVVNYKDVTIGNVRTCALQVGGITTALVTLTATTYTFGFLGYPMQHYENYVSYAQATAKEIDAGLIKLASTIDTALIAVLEANKNQHFPASILDYYAETGDALQVPQASKNDLYNRIGSIMSTMDYAPGADVVTNHLAMAFVRQISNQGSSNSTNLSFQLLGYTWYPDNRVVNGSGVEQTLYLVAPNSLAIVFRNSPDARAKSRIHESKYWDIFPNAPYIGADLDLFYQAECADASAVQASGMAKLTQTKVESWQFAVDVFTITPYNSAPATTFTPIIKIEVLEA